MGFRTGAYAKVWQVTPKSDARTELRISTSRKDRRTGQYEQDFSGFVSCCGTAAAKRASLLAEGARIRLGDVDVTTKYDPLRKITYTNYWLFSFEDADGGGKSAPAEPGPEVDGGELDDDSRLPF